MFEVALREGARRASLEYHHKNELEINRLEQELQHAKNRREMTHGYLRANFGSSWEQHYEQYKKDMKDE